MGHPPGNVDHHRKLSSIPVQHRLFRRARQEGRSDQVVIIQIKAELEIQDRNIADALEVRPITGQEVDSPNRHETEDESRVLHLPGRQGTERGRLKRRSVIVHHS